MFLPNICVVLFGPDKMSMVRRKFMYRGPHKHFTDVMKTGNHWTNRPALVQRRYIYKHFYPQDLIIKEIKYDIFIMTR